MICRYYNSRHLLVWYWTFGVVMCSTEWNSVNMCQITFWIIHLRISCYNFAILSIFLKLQIQAAYKCLTDEIRWMYLVVFDVKSLFYTKKNQSPWHVFNTTFVTCVTTIPNWNNRQIIQNITLAFAVWWRLAEM